MAEQRKSWHGQAWDFSQLADEQIAQWPAPFRPRWVISTPGRRYGKTDEQARAAGYVKPELEQLQQDLERLNAGTGFTTPQLPKEEVDLRTAFVAFLEAAAWTCERCGRKLDKRTLKVPPPVGGVFHMYCSSECAEGDAG